MTTSKKKSENLFTEQNSLKETKRGVFSPLKDAVGIISAGAGLFAAILYLAGRSYAAGYFEEMNIPVYQVTFSMWEYGEVAWLPLLLYPIVLTIVSSFLMGIFSRLLDFLSPLLRRAVTWLKTQVKVRFPTIYLPVVSRETQFWFSVSKRASFVLLLLGLVIFTLNFIHSFGQINGRAHVTTASTPVEVVSTIPLSLDENKLPITSSSGADFYVYTELYLLTVNQGKYFFFKEIDQETCRPAKIYVVESNQTLQMNLLPLKSLTENCK